MQYAWLIWSLILLGIWLVIYSLLATKDKKTEMLKVSLWTLLLGFTEPIFVPKYWLPPSLFNLALKTGFDIESLIFSFAIGGIVVVLYEQIFHTSHEKMPASVQHLPRHRYHLLAIISAPVIFILLALASKLNPIYIGGNRHGFRGIIYLVLSTGFKEKNVSERVSIPWSLFLLFLDSYYPLPWLCGKSMELENNFWDFDFGHSFGRINVRA